MATTAGPNTLKPGDRVIVPEGCGYNLNEFGAFRRATEDIEVVVSDVYGGRAHFTLPNGGKASTVTRILRRVEEGTR